MELLDVLMVIARVILIGVFIVSGVAKLFDLEGSKRATASFGIPKPLADVGGVVLPFVEIGVAILLLFQRTTLIAGVLALVLFLAFTAGMAIQLAKGNKPACHCFGQLSTEPIGKHSIIRNAVLSAIAAYVVYRGLTGNPGPSFVSWMEGLSVFEWILLVLLIVVVLVLAGVVWLLVHLLGQNGRLLVRMDSIEEALANADIAFGDDEDEEDEEDEDEGLPVGSPAPAFSLTGLYGETATLDSLRARGNPVMLIFSDPGCGPCNALMPDVGKFQRELSNKVTVALISRGDVDANKGKATEHGLSNVLLQKDNEVADLYGTMGTPTGVLITTDGLIATKAAPGGDAIRRVIHQAAEGKIEKPVRVAAPAPKQAEVAPIPTTGAGSENIGKPAPVVELADLNGKTVKLSDFKGQPTAVLFWNPGCGFCKRMEGDIKGWEANPPAGAPKLLIVSTGEVEANKAHGFKSTVVIDSGFNVGRSFGASGTPSAVLVGADGNVQSAVGVGAPSVLGILGSAPSAAAPSAAPAKAPAQAPKAPAGAAVGSAAPAISLNDLDGKPVTLNDFRGSDTAVLFWNPGCGFCKRMEADVKAWEANPPAGAPKLLIVSTGEVDANKAHGFTSTIVLDSGFNVGRSFGASGTPSAVLVTKDGKIGSSVAVGAPGVLGILRNEAPAPQPANGGGEPAAAKQGSAAPVVRLPDINGGMFDLAEKRGERNVILFWNPGCGFCKRMADDIKNWEADKPAGAPNLILVSTGSADENRAMGIASTMLLDSNFSVGSQFGANGTPSAVLVDENGKVASDLAVGGPSVMALLRP